MSILFSLVSDFVKEKKVWLVLGLVGFIMILLAFFLPSLWIEKIYSQGFYPRFSFLWAWTFGIVPFSLAEILLVLLVAGAVFLLLKNILRKRSRRFFLRGFFTFICFILFTAGVFLFLWGLNYHRLSWAENNGWTARGGTLSQLETLTEILALEAQANRRLLPQDKQGIVQPKGQLNWNSIGLRRKVGLAYLKVHQTYPLLSDNLPPAKNALFPEIFSWTGIGGIFIPFTMEALVNAGPKDWSLAFTAAHESAHLRGWAREDEANFLAYFVLSQSGEPDLAYSAASMALLYTAEALNSSGPRGALAWKGMAKKVDPGIFRDWKAYFAYWQKYEGPVQSVSNQVNDAYLKSQGQKEGVQSYGRMVNLLLTWKLQSYDPEKNFR